MLASLCASPSLSSTPSGAELVGRAVLRDALDTRRHEVRDLAAHAVAPRPAPEVSEAVEQLRRVGVNLNQVLRRGDVVDADLLCELRDAVSALRGSLGDRTVL